MYNAYFSKVNRTCFYLKWLTWLKTNWIQVLAEAVKFTMMGSYMHDFLLHQIFSDYVSSYRTMVLSVYFLSDCLMQLFYGDKINPSTMHCLLSLLHFGI